jgi:coproporphyrinogen III oxidase-like Fe-S oxidoreductase
MAVFKVVYLGRTHGFAKLNKDLITLLPKKQPASTVRDYLQSALYTASLSLLPRSYPYAYHLSSQLWSLQISQIS